MRGCLLGIALLFVTTAGNAQYNFLLHKTYAERYEDIDITFFNYRHARYDSVSYFKETDKLQKLALKEDDYELYLEARWLHAAYYRNGKQKNGRHIVLYTEGVLKEAIAAGNKQIILRCYMLMGLYYLEVQHRYAPALNNFLRCYNVLNQVTVQEFPNKKEPLVLIGIAYYNFGDNTTAEKILKEAEQTPMVLSPTSQKGFVFIKQYNALGLVYRQKQQYDSAIYYFGKGYTYARQQGNTLWMRIINEDIATCYLYQGDYDKTLEIMDKGLPAPVDSLDYDNHYGYLKTIAFARLKKHDYVGAKPYLAIGRDIVMKTGADMRYERLSHFYRMMSMYHAGIGELVKANKYADSAFDASDSAKTRQKVMELAKVQEKVQLEQFDTEMQQAASEKKMQLLWRNALIVIMVLSGIILLLFITGQSRKLRQRNKLAEAEKDKGEAERQKTMIELQNAELQVNDFVKNIQEKNVLIESITAEMERYQTLPYSNELPVNTELLQQLQQSVLLTDEQWDMFKANFEKAHGGFLARLKSKMPDLTPAETRFIALSKLQLSYKEMAGMLGVSLQGVRNIKYRLRKKINLPEEGDMEELIDTI